MPFKSVRKILIPAIQQKSEQWLDTINSQQRNPKWPIFLICNQENANENNTDVSLYTQLKIGFVVQSPSCVWLFATPWTAACRASLSITISQSLLKLLFIELVMPSNHLILCRPLLFLPSVFPSIRVFSNECVLCIRWPKCRIPAHIF